MTAHRLPPTACRRKGFTLIELITVMAIITILATLAVSAIFRVKYNTRVNSARTSAIRICQALEAYQALMGRLPAYTNYTVDSDPYDNWEIIDQLNGIRNRDPLLKLKQSETSPNGGFKDPWGRCFRIWMWKGEKDVLDRFFQAYSDGPNLKWERGWPSGAESLPPDIKDPDDVAPKH